MEQKRKVKNLISIKSKKDGLLSALLILLWWALFLWAVGLWMPSFFMPSTVVKASVIDFNRWIENNAEEILNMSFAPQSDLSDIKANMYLSWRNFYISWVQLILSWRGNEGDSDKNINILWWSWMNIKSNNISIIWGENNKIEEYYDNATVLWWEGLKAQDWIAGTDPVVLLWWKGSKMQSSRGNAIIWWQDNIVGNHCENCFILWWNNNKAGMDYDTKNVIVWWTGVKVEGAEKVFVFSDGSIPVNIDEDWSNAFYFVVKNWVGFWGTPLKSWVTSRWPVKFWVVNINMDRCKPENVWVMWTWNGCLVWCTEGWALTNKWELIDNGVSCKNKCKENGSICMVSDFFGLGAEVHDYKSYCTWNVNTLNSNRCAENLSGNYKNVVYEKKLIPFNEKCSDHNDGERCIFKCDYQHPFVSSDWKSCVK